MITNRKFRLLATMILAVVCCSAHATDVTVYCDDNYPPYSYQEGEETKGIYYNILKSAFSRMEGYTVTINAIPWKRGLGLLESGRGFALYPPYYHPTKRPYMDYSLPIIEEKMVVFINEQTVKSRDPKKWPQDFTGLKIGKNRGFISSKDPEYLKALKDGRMIEEEAGGNFSNIMKLARGRIDAYMNDRLSILWEIERMRKNGDYDENKLGFAKIIEGPVLTIEHGYLGYTNIDEGKLFPFKDDFKKKFDAVLEQMKKDGEIDRIVKKFLAQ